MSTNVSAKPNRVDPNRLAADERPRAAWKQRLRDVERGLTLGFRRDSTLFFYFFVTSVVVAGGLVLGLAFVQWSMLVLSLTIVITAEMFQQVLKVILDALGHHFPESAQRAERIGSAGVFVAFFGAVVTVGIIFTERLMNLFAG